MKTISKLAFAGLLTALLMTACEKEPIQKNGAVGGIKTKQVTVGIRIDETTKTFYDVAEKKFSFMEGDRFGLIFNIYMEPEIPEYGRNIPFTFLRVDEDDPSLYIFGGTLPEEFPEGNYAFFAYYPYVAGMEYSSQEDISKIRYKDYYVSVKETGPYGKYYAIADKHFQAAVEQDYVEGGWSAGPMCASFYGDPADLTLTFKPQYNVWKYTIELSENMAEDQVTINGMAFSGNYVYDKIASRRGLIYKWGEDGPEEVTVLNYTSGDVQYMLMCDKVKIGKGESKDFYLVATPPSLLSSGITIAVVTEELGVIRFKTTERYETSLGTGSIYTFRPLVIAPES